MLIRAIFLCFLAIVVSGCASIHKTSAIANEIIANFSKAVEEKNAERFKSLFLNENVSWLVIVSTQDIHGFYKNEKNHKKVNLHEIVPFTNWLEKTKESTRVVFSNCKTSGDTDVMVTDCEYAFYLDGVKTNYGRECFTLVNTESGWRISGIAFSSTLPEKNGS
jgi:hypothetical protein